MDGGNHNDVWADFGVEVASYQANLDHCSRQCPLQSAILYYTKCIINTICTIILYRIYYSTCVT